MIKVTRINNSVLYLNPDLIESIEETPDTVIQLTTGKKFMVLESFQEILGRIVSYRKEIYTSLPTEIINKD